MHLILSAFFLVQDVKKKISKCKDEKSPILDLSKSEVGQDPRYSSNSVPTTHQLVPVTHVSAKTARAS